MQGKLSEKNLIYISALRNLIKEHREETGKSIYLISAEVQMPRSTWRNIEFGLRKDINLSTFCKIAEGLDISSVELLNELIKNLGMIFLFLIWIMTSNQSFLYFI